MAERRMFAKSIIDSDAFLDMPLSAQALYFHLSMRADDEGFLGNAKRVRSMIGASEDDFKLLIVKRFVIVFEDGITVIRHQHIDLSIKKHGLYSDTNPTGWQIEYANCPEEQLDNNERLLISDYANRGYQLRNKTAGGQDGGKFGIADNRPAKGYHDGLQQGYENARKEIKHLFDLYLTAVITANKPTKRHENALQKFYDFINGGPKQ